MAKKTHSFNVILSAAEMIELQRLADHSHCAKSYVIRQCIRWRSQMLQEATPICASGQRCFAPQLHQPIPAPRNPTEAA